VLSGEILLYKIVIELLAKPRLVTARRLLDRCHGEMNRHRLLGR
jgi:hypothetical protein